MSELLCHFGCVHAKAGICSCRCRGKGHGVPVRRLLPVRRTQKRDKQADYLAQRYTPDSPFPLPRHAGTPIRELSDAVLDYYLAGGLRHTQLYAVLRQVRAERPVVYATSRGFEVRLHG